MKSQLRVQLKFLSQTVSALYDGKLINGSAMSAGYDLRTKEDVVLKAGERTMIGTGVAIHINNRNFVGMVYSRSGMATKFGVMLANNVGVIDADYQGEIKLCLYNSGNEAIDLKAGERIAQLLIQPVEHPKFVVVSEFDNITKRGDGGFGSTGTK